MTELEVLCQQLAEAQALIEAIRKQEPVAFLAMQYEGGHESLETTFEGDQSAFPVYATAKAANDVLKDAQRYRWLREYLPSADTSVDDALVKALNPQEIDAVIDAVIDAAERAHGIGGDK